MKLQYEGKPIETVEGETVLESLLRAGVSVPWFCRSGTCQACVLKATTGEPPREASRSLKESWRQQGWFLACQARPEAPLAVGPCSAAALYRSRVERVERVGPGVLRVWLALPRGFDFRAGQFVHLERPHDRLMRPYSLASLPSDESLEMHIAEVAEGRMSSWLAGGGGEVSLRGPYGECHYLPGEPERPLVLAGSGTGLAPLLGIVRSALASGHQGPMRLYHAAATRAGLYQWSDLVRRSRENSTLSVIGCTTESEAVAPRAELRNQRLQEAVLGDVSDPGQCRFYLCGNPDTVRQLKKRLYLAGAALERIHADPFEAAAANGA